MQCTLGKNQDGGQEKTMYKLSHIKRKNCTSSVESLWKNSEFLF